MTGDEGTVLVVEDNRDLADQYAQWLSESYTTRTAYSGEAALDAMDETVDVVLLDRRLPDMTGSDVLDRIRAQDYDCRVAIISAVDPDLDIMDMPFDDYVVKPVLKSELHAVIERLQRLADYDEQFRESFELAMKCRALEAELPQSRLDSSDEYRAAVDRLKQLREQIDETFDRFGDEDFEAVYRDLIDDRDRSGAS